MADQFVKIHDPSVDADRKFKVKPRTRSIASALDDIDVQEMKCNEKLQALFDGIEFDDTRPDTPEERKVAINAASKSPEHRDDMVRFQCDRLNALTEPVGDLEAGELVWQRWQDDSVTEAQVNAWVRDVSEKADERPR